MASLETLLEQQAEKIRLQRQQEEDPTPSNLGFSDAQMRSIRDFGFGKSSEGDLLKDIYEQDIFEMEEGLKDRFIPKIELPENLQKLKNTYELNKDRDWRTLITGQLGDILNLPIEIRKELVDRGSLKKSTKTILIDKINNSRLPLNIKQIGKDHYRLIDYSKDVGDSRFNLTAGLKDGKVQGNLGFRYQPSKDAFIDARARFDSRGDPLYEVKFGKRFSQGGMAGIESLNLQYTPESDEDVTATELINHLSKQGIKVVDYDENEDSIKNRLFSMAGEQPRGHIFPSSWLNPSGELTIYVPKNAKKTPTAFKRFLVEEVKHADQIREAPFSTAVSAIYEGIKEKASQLPSRLLSKLPDFVSEEESEEYFQKLHNAGVETGSVGGRDIDEIESPYWKDRSGIGQLFRGFRYHRYADPESVEGIHRNRERYAPVLKKYGIDDIDIFS